jgi:hypothetical protein
MLLRLATRKRSLRWIGRFVIRRNYPTLGYAVEFSGTFDRVGTLIRACAVVIGHDFDHNLGTPENAVQPHTKGA